MTGGHENYGDFLEHLTFLGLGTYEKKKPESTTHGKSMPNRVSQSYATILTPLDI